MTGFALNGEYIPLLGILWPGTRTLLSPLLPHGDQQEQDDIRTVLGPAGLLDNSGALIPPCKDAMSILADSYREITADFIRPEKFHTVTKYFSQGGKTFTHVTDQSGTGLGYPELSPQDMGTICDVQDLWSNTAADPADLAFDAAEARILAAMLDGERISVRDAVTGSANPRDLSITPTVQTRSAIEHCITAATEHHEDRLFLGLLNNGDNSKQMHSIAPCEQDFSDLVNRGLIRGSGNGFELTDSLLYMARRALFTDMAVRISIRYAVHGSPVITECGHGIRSDGMLFWFISPAGSAESILLKYLPSGKFDAIMQHLFNDPSWSLSRIDVPAAIVKQRARFCRQCGTQITEGKKLCKSCGTKVG